MGLTNVGRRLNNVIFGIALIFAGCSGAGSTALDAGADSGVSRAHALLGGSLEDSPWPSDVFLVGGKLRVGKIPFAGQRIAHAQIVTALAELDGAPVKTSVFFRVDRAGALPSGPLPGKAKLFDLSTPNKAPVELALFYRAATRHLVALTPHDYAMTPGHRYACVIGQGVVSASVEMRAALSGQGAHADAYRPLRERAAALGIDLETIGAATVFKVGEPHARLDALVTQIDKLAAPKASVTSVISGAALDDFFGTPDTKRAGIGDKKGIAHDAVGWVVLGTFDSPRFLSNKTAQLGTIAYDSARQAKQNGTMSVPFLLALPKTVGAEPLPLVIFQHGLNSSRAQVAAVANDYARAGYATIGIDALWHGDRAVGPLDAVHNLSEKNEPDGLADLNETGAMLRLFAITGESVVGIAPFDGRAIQDNFRQAVVDIAQLVRLLQSGDLSAIVGADKALASLQFDASRLVYTGESFGSILGVLALATIPELRAGVLAVGAAGLFTPTFANSPFFGDILQPLLSLLFDRRLELGDPNTLPGNAQLSLALLQGVLEPGDPVAYAQRVREQGKSVLLLQAYSDEILPNQAGELLAKLLGAHAVNAGKYSKPLRYTTLPTATATLKGNVNSATIGIVNVDPGTHGMFSGFSGKRLFELSFPPAKRRATAQPIDNPTEWLRRTAIRFIESYRKDGVPTIDTRDAN